jgi:citrate lyase subunit beta/citryl-CoA lyase
MAPDPVPVARRLARSYLFAPGNHEYLLERVLTAGADAVVIDLEDAVAAEHKTRARAHLALAAEGPGSPPVD